MTMFGVGVGVMVGVSVEVGSGVSVGVIVFVGISVWVTVSGINSDGLGGFVLPPCGAVVPGVHPIKENIVITVA